MCVVVLNTVLDIELLALDNLLPVVGIRIVVGLRDELIEIVL